MVFMYIVGALCNFVGGKHARPLGQFFVVFINSLESHAIFQYFATKKSTNIKTCSHFHLSMFQTILETSALTPNIISKQKNLAQKDKIKHSDTSLVQRFAITGQQMATGVCTTITGVKQDRLEVPSKTVRASTGSRRIHRITQEQVTNNNQVAKDD